MKIWRHGAVAMNCLVLTGCMTAADAPSLAQRPIELRRDVADAALPAPPSADPAIVAQADALVAQATRGSAALAAASSQSAAIRAGLRAPSTSDRWIVAQTQLSALEVARRDSTDALAQLDAMLLTNASAVADGRASSSPVIETARGAVADIVARQDALIASFTR